MKMPDFAELMSRQEELCSELEEYYTEETTFPMIRHPLLYNVPHHPSMNAFVNARFKLLSKMAQEMANRGDWVRYVCHHERPYRLNVFVEVGDKIEAREYWELLGELWVDCENIYQNYDIWRRLLFTGNRQKWTFKFMKSSERRAMARLPNMLTVYRGTKRLEDDGHGFSWTTDFEVAEKFANRFLRDDEEGVVYAAEVPKYKIFAYKTVRGESEIIVDPAHLTNIKVIEL